MGAFSSAFNVAFDAQPSGYFPILTSDGYPIITSDGYFIIMPAQTPSAFAWGVELELNGEGGGWTDVTQDIIAKDGIICEYGINGPDPTDRVASAGSLKFSLDNSESNAAGVLGYYSVLNPLTRVPGFDYNIGVRFWLQYGYYKVYKHRGKLADINVIPGVREDRKVICQSLDWMDEAAKIEVPPLAAQTNKRVDQLLNILLDAMTEQPVARNFNTGQDYFTFALDGATGQKLMVREEMNKLALSEQGYIYITGDQVQGGTLAFEARGHRSTELNATLTIDNAMIAGGRGFVMTTSRSDIYRTVQVVVHPTELTSVGVELFNLSGATTLVKAGATLNTITGTYKDPSTNNTVGGINMIAPVATTDYTANSASDGSGTDLTSSVTVTAVYTGEDVLYTITNNSGTDAYITKLSARGTGVKRNDLTIERKVIGSYGDRTLVIDLPYGTDVNIATNIASYLATLLSSPLNRAKQVKFYAAYSDDFLNAALLREPGDRIAVSEQVSGYVLAPFNIQYVRLELTPGRTPVLWCTYDIVPWGLDAWWTPSATGTSGGTITEIPGYRVHEFTSSGVFIVPAGNPITFEYELVGDGGDSSNASGGGGFQAGGSGAEVKRGTVTLPAGAYTISISNVDKSSTFDVIATAAGGRNGGWFADGGSGVNGAGGSASLGGAFSGGSGTAFRGGNGYTDGVSLVGAGGGAGCMGQGGDADSTGRGGDGGLGTTSTIKGYEEHLAYGGCGVGSPFGNDGTDGLPGPGKGGGAPYGVGTKGRCVIRYPISS